MMHKDVNLALENSGGYIKQNLNLPLTKHYSLTLVRDAVIVVIIVLIVRNSIAIGVVLVNVFRVDLDKCEGGEEEEGEKGKPLHLDGAANVENF